MPTGYPMKKTEREIFRKNADCLNEGEVWYVKIKGASTLCKKIICHITEYTVLVKVKGVSALPARYLKSDLLFIERVPSLKESYGELPGVK